MFRHLLLLTPPPLPEGTLSPQQVREYLSEHRAWERQRMTRQCMLALGAMVASSILMMTTGTLAWILAGFASSAVILLLEGQRWLPIRRRRLWGLSASLIHWLNSQPDPQAEYQALRGSEDESNADWRQVVRRVRAHMEPRHTQPPTPELKRAMG